MTIKIAVICPRCGKEAYIEIEKSRINEQRYARCNDCGLIYIENEGYEGE